MKSKLHLFTSFSSLIVLAIFVVMISLSGCSSQSDSVHADEIKDLDMPEEVQESYLQSADLLDDVTLSLKNYRLTQSDESFEKLHSLYQYLGFDYDADDLSDDAKKFCQEFAFKVDSVRFIVKSALEDGLSQYRQVLVNEDDKLIDQEASFPVYLPKGAVLYIGGECSEVMDVKLYNADSEHIISTWKKKKSLQDSIVVSNGAVYVLNVTTKGSQYLTLNLKRNFKSLNELDKGYEIATEEVECKSNDSRAKKIEAVTIHSVFEEPHKVTLRSQGKALFSGGSRSVVAMQVPSGCTDMLYSLRISTSQSDVSSDGQFCKKVNEKYKEIKFLGLPLYESHGTSSNIFRELLNASEPNREEEAYCNLYVFTNSAQAKKFMDGSAVSELKYNVDLSKQGTQSCNDRISTKGLKTIYFGFENTRMRYSVYLWLESLATVKKTEYVKTKYVLER